ncbi:MAG: ABC transporter permease [Nostocoides sp.]
MRLHGIRTVAGLELKQRARTSRWPIVLLIWFLFVAGVTVLSYVALNKASVKAGPTLYDVTTFLVLGLSMLVVPSLTATSVNGDREAGVLATLQTTLLTPTDIILGKLAASWAIALVFLGVSSPFLIWAWIAGGIGIGQVIGSLLVLSFVLAVTCAIGLALSTLTARPVASAVLTYLSMAGLVFGTVIVFFLSFFLVQTHEQVRYFGIPDAFWQSQTKNDDGSITPDSVIPTVGDCRHLTRDDNVIHTERIWWLLPMNPFVVVADAAPGRTETDPNTLNGFQPMRAISIGARAARAGADTRERQECNFGNPGDPAGLPPLQSGPIYPYGLAFYLALGAGATWLAVRRTRTPVTRLPNGTRIA